MFRRDAFHIPPAPMALTIGGLMPFFAGAGALLLFRNEPGLYVGAQLVLLAYAAVIMSFLGGVRWGVEMVSPGYAPRWGVMMASVIGSLAGWALVVVGVLVQLWPELFAIAAGLLVLHWVWDLASHRNIPAWYDGLRTLATLGAGASLMAAWAFTRFAGLVAG